jgi:hypothetical protein
MSSGIDRLKKMLDKAIYHKEYKIASDIKNVFIEAIKVIENLEPHCYKCCAPLYQRPSENWRNLQIFGSS